MVKGVWGIKFEIADASTLGYAGGKPDVVNSRARYMKANYSHEAPFGTSQ